MMPWLFHRLAHNQIAPNTSTNKLPSLNVLAIGGGWEGERRRNFPPADPPSLSWAGRAGQSIPTNSIPSLNVTVVGCVGRRMRNALTTPSPLVNPSGLTAALGHARCDLAQQRVESSLPPPFCGDPCVVRYRQCRRCISLSSISDGCLQNNSS